MKELEGSVAIVTGAARNIGRAIALDLADAGAAVTVLTRSDFGGVKAVAAEIEAKGGRALAMQGDVTRPEDARRMVDETLNKFGRIDILVNNAGIDTTSQVVEMSTEMWDEMIRVNLRSIFLCTRAVLPGMLQRKWGRIINMSSQLAHKGAADMAHYAAAKAGVLGFTRSLAYEVAREGITVNAICPGPIDTELFRNIPEAWRKRKLAELPIGRAGTVDEIAPTAVMLASDEGSYYIGASLNPNGGDVMI